MHFFLDPKELEEFACMQYLPEDQQTELDVEKTNKQQNKEN